MYSCLLVSGDKAFTNLALKFVPHINNGIAVETATTIRSGTSYLESVKRTDIVVFDQGGEDVIDMMNAMGRIGSSLPVVLTVKDPSAEFAVDALNAGVDYLVLRDGRDPMDIFTELTQKIVLAAERRQTEKRRQIEFKRMSALVEIAQMSDSAFSGIVDYALDRSIELTESKIGYVASYDKDARRLTMLAWSASAMKQCSVGIHSFEFDLDTAGIWGEPVRTRRSVIVNDYNGNRVLMKGGLPAGHVPLDRLLMVPIYIDGRLMGTAGVGNKETEYTGFDEIQLTRMMEGMFSIYSKLEDVKKSSRQTDVIRMVLETGAMGFMYVTVDMNVVLLNNLGSKVLGCEPVNSSYVPMDGIKSQNAKELRMEINNPRIHGSGSRLRLNAVIDGVERPYDVEITNMVASYRQNPGFAVTMVDISDIESRNERIDRAVEHINILEGPVFRSISELTTDAQRNINDSRALVTPLSRLKEATDFIRDYRNVGIRDPIWAYVTDLVGRIEKSTYLGGIDLKVRADGFKILADPAFHSVFKNLMTNTVRHGRTASRIDIGCRIQQGMLTIYYQDDGVGIPEEMRGSLFNQTEKGKFGLFLVANIVRASGYSIECVDCERGARFEISVPSSKYMMD